MTVFAIPKGLEQNSLVTENVINVELNDTDIDRMLTEQTGLPIIIADDPLTCVVRGCGRALLEAEKLGDVFVYE